MPTKRTRRLRSAGQDVPACNLQTLQVLQWGDCLIAWPTEFDMSQAEAAWQAHRQAALDAWALYWATQGITPACWARRVFDGVKQIPLAGLDAWQKDRVQEIEANVKGFKVGD